MIAATKNRIIYCEIPETSMQNYITGQHALNVVAEDGTSADWHPHIWFWEEGVQKPTLLSLAGVNMHSTNQIFGSYGIIECKDWLAKSKGFNLSHLKAVYRANYVRALLDLVYHTMMERVSANRDWVCWKGAVFDWFDRNEDKIEFYQKCIILKDSLTGQHKTWFVNWVSSEIQHDDVWGGYTLDPQLSKYFLEVV